MGNSNTVNKPKEYTTYPKGNALLTLSYIALIGIWAASSAVVIPVPVNLIVTSTLIIFIGCHRSLALLETGEDGKAVIERETLSTKDAMQFPFIGSAALGSLYIAFKFFDKDWVNFLLSLYFSLAGTFTLVATTAPIVAKLGSDKWQKVKYGPKFKLPLLGDIDLEMSVPEMLALIPSVVFSYYYFKTKHFLMNNVLGISFCIQAIEKISLGSYQIGAILLSGLFLYDIFWVFGTDVMVTVAKSFDGPIKLLFPRVLAAEGVKAEFSLLGLGDIVIPGLFVAILIRLDAMRSKVDPKGAENVAFPKPFFFGNIVSYALGLGITVFVMYYFNHAQPALLYLVPCCLGGSMLTGLVIGGHKEMWEYNEEAPKKDEVNKDGSASAETDKKRS